MPVDETGKEGRADTVVDDLCPVGWRLDGAHLGHPSAIINQHLAVRSDDVTVEHRRRTDNAHPPWWCRRARGDKESPEGAPRPKAQQSNTYQQSSLRSRWSSRTSSRTG
jgi:hypothetical protein